MGQNLVGAVAEEDVIGGKPEAGSDGLGNIRPRRVGVEPQPVIRRGADRRQRQRRGAMRVLVGVELEERAAPRLLAGGIGLQLLHRRAPESVHVSPLAGLPRKIGPGLSGGQRLR